MQKSFWSCTHVNSCQKYTLYINLHILLNILCKTTLDIQESRKSIKFLKRQQELIKRPNHYVLLSHDLLHTKFTLYMNLHILLMFLIMA